MYLCPLPPTGIALGGKSGASMRDSEWPFVFPRSARLVIVRKQTPWIYFDKELSLD